MSARFEAPFVLLTGGKGGVGKTTLATNLAVQLAGGGARVLLVDLDLGLANVDVLLELAPRANIEDALAGRCELADCVVEGPGGVHVLPAGNGTAGMARLDDAQRDRLLEALVALAAGYDLVVGDSAAGIGPDVLAFGAAAHVVLVVTTPDPSAMTDAYGLIKALESAAAERGLEVATPELVLNQVSGIDEAETSARKLAEVCQRFLARSPRLAGWVPRSTRVLDAGRRRVPFALARAKDGSKPLERACLERLAVRVLRLCGRCDAPLSATQAGGTRVR